MNRTISIDKVVKENICVGCGACKVSSQGAIDVRVDRLGIYQADLTGVQPVALAAANVVCPFSDEARNEDQIADSVYKSVPAIKFDRKIGYYQSLYAGRRQDTESVPLTSSGGLTSWISEELLALGMIDGVIHVGGDAVSTDRLVSYCVSHSLDEVRTRRKSQYYSVSFGDALLSVRGNGKKYMFVGVPCFVKAARLLAEQDEVIRAQLKYFTALVCGHMKSSAFAELLAWQTGVPPDRLRKVDFRIKVEGEAASNYEFGAWAQGDPTSHKRTTRQMVGGNWGHAAFQLKACDYCDDIWGETADVALGDAWLPQYANDWRGTNVLAVRHPDIDGILQRAIQDGRVSLDNLGPEALVKSQDGNYRHRWDGLSVRLGWAKRAGRWVPRKRIAPNSRPVGFLRRQVVRIRQRMATSSHELFEQAKEANSLQIYTRGMLPLAKAMGLVYKLINRPKASVLLRRIAGRFASSRTNSA